MSYSMYLIPSVVFLILVVGMVKKVDSFRCFTQGAGEGIMTIAKLLPSLMGLMVAIGVFRASGVLDQIVKLAAPFFEKLGFEAELVPLIFIRPVSGSGALAVLEDILKNYGPDTKIGFTASVMMGSTETIFYTIGVYTGNTGIKKAPGVLLGALASSVAATLAAFIISDIVFGH